MLRRASAVVDLGAIAGNLDRARELAGNATVMAVVKADAYGHGMGPVARTARRCGVDWLGVALPSEALALRAMGDEGRVLAWLWAPGDPAIPSCIRSGVDLSISGSWALAEVGEAAAAVGAIARVHLKVDTGLSRNGVAMSEWEQFLGEVVTAAAGGRIVVEGIWSHLAEADAIDAVATGNQRAVFELALAQADAMGIRPRLRHLSSSGGLWTDPDSRYDLVRVGIAMYGLAPGPELGLSRDLGLVPAMTLRAPLVNVKPIAAGVAVSYGSTWRAQEPTYVGLVPLGYADGIPRAAGNLGTVTVDGRRVPIVGRVAMDQFVVDLGTSSANAAVGDEVVLFGSGRHDEQTADEWARTVGTIGYEIVTCIGARVPREYVNVPGGLG